MGAEKRILIADDDPTIRTLLTDALQGQGYLVTSVSDGNDAYRTALDGNFDLIVLDVYMPQVNGLEILAELKKRGNRTPIIMMSGQATISTLRRAITFGSVSLLDKPFGTDVFLDLVRTTIAHQEPKKKHRKVLVVDDHDPTREMLAAIVGEAGYDVTAVSNGHEAITAAKSPPHFDMAIVDINMPQMRGDELVGHLNRSSPETVLILMTGEATRDEIQSGYRKGAYTLIRKPFEVNALLYALSCYEQESDRKRDEVRKTEAFRKRPFFYRWYVGVRKTLSAPVTTPQGRIVRTVLVILLAMFIGLGFLSVATSLEKWFNDGQAKVFSFFERMEGYLERDEEREIQPPHGVRNR